MHFWMSLPRTNLISPRDLAAQRVLSEVELIPQFARSGGLARILGDIMAFGLKARAGIQKARSALSFLCKT